MSNIEHPSTSDSPEPGLFGFEAKELGDGRRLAELPDLRAEVPDLARRLLPNQRVIHVQHIDLGLPPRLPPPSSSRALLKLYGASRLAQIGSSGPSHAAQSLAPDHDERQVRLLEALFGRDALHMAIHLRGDFPALLISTLLRLAELQGVDHELTREEEPGRIVHWAPPPGDPVAEHITEVNGWSWPNYGSIDATPMFILASVHALQHDPGLLHINYRSREGDDQPFSLAFQRAVRWLEDRVDSNAEGLLEFRMTQPKGVWNQAWKDTPESYVHADGAYANHRDGIASIEVQALAHETLRGLSSLDPQIGRSALGSSFRERTRAGLDRAELLRRSVLEHFWVEDQRGAFLALATDRAGGAGSIRPLAVRTSNMGHALTLLASDDPDQARLREIIRCLFSEELLDRNGIRTLGSREVRFLPTSYHCGSVWPWDTYAIARQLRMCGAKVLARDLSQRVLRSVNEIGYFVEFLPGSNAAEPELMRTNTIVDLYDGPRDHFSQSYRAEKPAQLTQGWTVEAIRDIKKGVSSQTGSPAQYTDLSDLEQELLLELGERAHGSV